MKAQELQLLKIVNLLSIRAPMLIVAWGFLFAVLIILTDLSLLFLGSLLFLFCCQLFFTSYSALAKFLIGLFLGLILTHLQLSLPAKGAFPNEELKVEVVGENVFVRGARTTSIYKVRVVKSDCGYGFLATLKPNKDCSLQLDQTYLIPGSIVRDEKGIRIYPERSKSVEEVGSLFPWNRLRQKARDICLRRSALLYPPSDEREFIETVAFGGKLDPLRRAQLNRFGLDHIAAVSGFHFGLVAGFAWWLSLLFFRGIFARIAVIIALVAYGFIVGAQPSVLRALIAALLFVFAPLFSRRANGLNNIGVGLSILLIYEPLFVFSMGFQLSFAATMGILLLYKPLCHLFIVGEDLRGDWLMSTLCVSLSALLMALPIQIVQTGAFSLLGPLYNLIVPLAVSWIMLMYLSSLLMPLGLSHLFAWPTEKMLSFLIQLFNGAPVNPHGLYQVSCPPLVGAVIFVALIQGAIWAWQRQAESATELPLGV